MNNDTDNDFDAWLRTELVYPGTFNCTEHQVKRYMNGSIMTFTDMGGPFNEYTIVGGIAAGVTVIFEIDAIERWCEQTGISKKTTHSSTKVELLYDNYRRLSYSEIYLLDRDTLKGEDIPTVLFFRNLEHAKIAAPRSISAHEFSCLLSNSITS